MQRDQKEVTSLGFGDQGGSEVGTGEGHGERRTHGGHEKGAVQLIFLNGTIYVFIGESSLFTHRPLVT